MSRRTFVKLVRDQNGVELFCELRIKPGNDATNMNEVIDLYTMYTHITIHQFISKYIPCNGKEPRNFNNKHHMDSDLLWKAEVWMSNRLLLALPAGHLECQHLFSWSQKTRDTQTHRFGVFFYGEVSRLP